MIIDKILDRYDGDAYDPKDFYDAMMSYEEGTDFSISRALDSGEEEDIKRELCAYIDDGNYNPKIKDFINSVKWLEADDGKDYSKEFDILGESKKGESKFKCSMKKKKEAKKHTCSMQKKKESLAKKSEADSGAMTWTVTVEFDDNGKSVRKDYVVKAHNRESAIDQAKLKPQHTNPDAKNIKVTYCKLGESLVKKHTCSMQKKKESLAKKCEEYIPNVRERLWSFIDAGFITTEEIGDYLLRALSVDTLENVYGWLVQDEMIPSEETLADEHQLKFNNEGEFVSIETDDTKEG